MALIRKVFGPAVTEVRRREVDQPDRRNRQVTLKQRSRYPVHPVHDPTIWADDDRIRPIEILNQLEVLDDGANRGRPMSVAEPVVRVHLAN